MKDTRPPRGCGVRCSRRYHSIACFGATPVFTAASRSRRSVWPPEVGLFSPEAFTDVSGRLDSVYAAGSPGKQRQIMIVRRRTWLYRLHGERDIRSVAFKVPLTASQAKEALRRSVGMPEELWARSVEDLEDAERR